MPEICVAEPSEFQATEVNDFVSLVLVGGEVMARGLRNRVLRAEQLAFLREKGALLGVAGLKSPTKKHRREVADGSRTKIDDETYPFELGWVFIVPNARNRRLSLPLCQPLVTASAGRGVFATSRAGNNGMHSTLLKLGFARVGEEWSSNQSDDRLALFLKAPTPQSRKHDKAKQPSRPAKRKSKGRADTDEQYIVALCDEVLGRHALRQHKFDFLRGDPGKNGQGHRLPVDAYYADLQLVVEYRERQHTEPHAFFDKPDRITLSGVHRGRQRALYDERRRTVLPVHGIALIEVPVSEFTHDKRGRLVRDRDADVAVVERLLKPWLVKRKAR